MLNARYHEQEAFIVAEAGVPGTVTIATNMAGRGTDIQLGGNLEMRMQRWKQEQRALGLEPSDAEEAAYEAEAKTVIDAAKQQALAAGGLYVLGTERHESRRIDNQLRGRTGRQGDPGQSKFFLSCEDDLLRIFAGERLDAIMRTFGVEEGEAITHKWLNGAISTAQRKVEARNYEIRKNLLKYDDVVNDQRKSVFETRQEFMESEDLSEIVTEFRKDTLTDFTSRFLPPKVYAEEWDVAGLTEKIKESFDLDLPIADWVATEGVSPEDIHAKIEEATDARFVEREAIVGPERWRQVEKNFLLQMIDLQWREHLQHLDHLRQVIGLRGYGQRDPLKRVQDRGLLPLREAPHRPAPERDPLAVHGGIPGGAPARKRLRTLRIGHEPARRRARPRFQPVSGGPPGPPHGRERARARLGRRRRRRSLALRPRAPAGQRPAGRLGTNGPQHGLPLRQRQEVQALPRGARLTGQ